MKNFTKAQFKKAIKDAIDKYSFLSMTDIVKQMSVQYPNQFEMIAKAEIELIQEDMGL